MARIQWKLALRPPPELGGNEKLALWLLLVPLLAFVALALGFLGYMAGSRLSAEPVFFHNLLLGLGAFLMLFTGISMPFADKSLSGFEIGRLFHLPVRPAEILASQVLGNALNPGIVIIPGAFMAGCVAGSLRAGFYPLAARCFAAGFLWLGQLALLIMVADYALLYVRRLRLLRRLAALLAILMGLGLVWILQAYGRSTESEEAARSFAPVKRLVLDLWGTWGPVLDYAPGISPVAWVGGQPGWWAVLLVSLAETALLFAAGARLLDGIMAGSVVEATPEEIPGRKTSGARGAGLLERLPIWPFLVKDLRLLFREKNLWLTLIGIGILLAVVPQMVLEFAGDHPARFGAVAYNAGHWVGPLSALAVVMLLGSLAWNQLGVEGTAIQLLFSSPVPRWRFLAGKNIALLTLSTACVTCAEAGLLYRQTRWQIVLADYVFFLTLQAAYLGAGNFASILWPYPSSLSGKATGLKVSQVRILLVSLYQILLLIPFGCAMVPLFAGRLAMGLFRAGGGAYWFVTICMLAYGGIFYGLALTVAGTLFGRLEPHVFEKLAQAK